VPFCKLFIKTSFFFCVEIVEEQELQIWGVVSHVVKKEKIPYFIQPSDSEFFSLG